VIRQTDVNQASLACAASQLAAFPKAQYHSICRCLKNFSPGNRLPPMLQKRIDDQPSISREMVREAQQILHQHLKRVGLKHTAQRDTILQTFLETRDHLSTNELHRLVQQKDARIGFTTVYRTLKLLAECGLASEVAFHDGIARFEHQYNRRSHHHMVCTECGGSVEFFSPEVDRLEQEIGRKHHYATTRHTFQIYGVCEDCRKKLPHQIV
jgi:Fur family ferric uptake transcriptional regulator